MTRPSVFGVQMGQKLEQLDVLEARGNGRYRIMPPQPFGDFEKYQVEVAPNAGVFWLTASGGFHDDDGSGRAIRVVFGVLLRALEAKYDRYEMIDTMPGNTRPKDWVMAIQNGADFEARWDKEYGSSLPEGLDHIVLSVQAIENTTSYVFLQYCFSNFPDGQRELDLASPL